MCRVSDSWKARASANSLEIASGALWIAAERFTSLVTNGNQQDIWFQLAAFECGGQAIVGDVSHRGEG